MCLMTLSPVDRLRLVAGTAAAKHNGQTRERTAEEIVLAGEAVLRLIHPATHRQRARIERIVNPELVRYFRGVRGIARAHAFLLACRRDPALRHAAERQGIDLDGWQEYLDLNGLSAKGAYRDA